MKGKPKRQRNNQRSNTKTTNVEYLDKTQLASLRADEKASTTPKKKTSEMSEKNDNEKKNLEAKKAELFSDVIDPKDTKVIAALDKLGQRLVESESERQSLKALVDQARDLQNEMQKSLNKSLARQEALEEQLRGVKQQGSRLTKKMENMDQQRARFQRRIQKIESMAVEAQESLESKALVLLTDQAIAQNAHLPYARAGESLPLVPFDNAIEEEAAPAPKAWWQREWSLSGSTAIFAAVFAVGFGWLVSQSMKPSEQIFALTQDGGLARIDLNSGQITPLQTILDQMSSPNTTLNTQSLSGSPLMEPAQMSSLTEEQINADQSLPLDERIETDETLEGALSELQDQAFEGVPEAQHDLAALYTSGQGVEIDYGRAAVWFREAANSGIANAAYNLGVMYHQGLGVSKDMTRALDWYRRAAQLGHPEAQYNLGIAYVEGIGTDYNANLAASFFQQAALNGISEAAYNLGIILENGLLGNANPDLALIWYRTASDQGSLQAKRSLERLAAKQNKPVGTAGMLAGDVSLATRIDEYNQIEPAAGEERTLSDDMASFMERAERAGIPTAEQTIVMQIQELLSSQGFYEGSEDGLQGPQTMDAIKDYQVKYGLNPDGVPTDELLGFMLTQKTLDQ